MEFKATLNFRKFKEVSLIAAQNNRAQSAMYSSISKPQAILNLTSVSMLYAYLLFHPSGFQFLDSWSMFPIFLPPSFEFCFTRQDFSSMAMSLKSEQNNL